MSLWVVYTAAVFLSRSGAFSDRQRAAFLTANNAAMFGLLTVDVLKDPEAKFWILPMVVGVALLGCALAAARSSRTSRSRAKATSRRGWCW